MIVACALVAMLAATALSVDVGRCSVAEVTALAGAALVSYVGGRGSKASVRVEEFGAFWLENVHTGAKTIDGRFIRYQMPGAGGDPFADDTGLFTFQLVG